jgi:HEAT repeat protein
MTRATTAAAVAPLLLELARATRARQFHPASHPSARGPLRRASISWLDALAESGELRIDLGTDGFALLDGTQVDALGLRELWQLLRAHGVRELRAMPGLDRSEFESFVELIGRRSGAPFDEQLAECRVEHLQARVDAPVEAPLAATRSEPEPAQSEAEQFESEPAQLEAEPVQPEQRADEPAQLESARIQPAPEPGSAAAPAETADPEEAEPEATGALPISAPSGSASADTAVEANAAALEVELPLQAPELTRLLEELEGCDDCGPYRIVANRIQAELNRLLAARNYPDAYRAALAYTGHAAEAGSRTEETRAEALAQLRPLQANSELIRFVIDEARLGAACARVDAIRVLTSLGQPAVVCLLRQRESSSAEAMEDAASILIAMGDGAFPAIVEELDSANPIRVKRAIVLLGDLQNPRGVPYLGQLIHHATPHIAREAAQSLGRIGDDRALQILISALQREDALAILAANCLSRCNGLTALRALIGVAREKSGRTEPVRIEAIRGIGRVGNRVAVPVLCEILAQKRMFSRGHARALRIAAATALGLLGGDEATNSLQTYARRGNGSVRQACSDALRTLTT